MKPALLIFLTSAALTAAPGSILRASRMGRLMILEKVYVNGDGPFRMMVDTGNASSLIRPSIARKLGLRPNGWLEQSTAAADRRVPAVLLDELRIGNVMDNSAEAMIAEIQLQGVDGILGQSWLIRHDYLIDYRNHRVVVDGEPPESGVRAELRSLDGRPAIVAEVAGRRQELIIDSGAEILVLFEGVARVSPVVLQTNRDSVAAQTGAVDVAIADGCSRTMTAARVSPSRPGPGLLPAGAFDSVYISNREGVVLLGKFQ